jgi:PAS domain S-box-containing protein
MPVETQVTYLSLSFVWLFAAIFTLEVYLCFGRTRLPYLKFGLLALLTLIGRQTVTVAIVLAPTALLYLLYSILLFAEVLLTLQMVLQIRNASLTRRDIILAVAAYLAVLVLNNASSSNASTLDWYVVYAPTLIVQCLCTIAMYQTFATQTRGSGWMFCWSVAILVPRFALPYLSPDGDVAFGLTYIIDSLVATLMIASVIQIAFEQLIRDKASSLSREESTIASLQFLIDNVADIVISHSVTGRILNWNKRAEGLFGYSSSEAVSLNIADLLDEPTLGQAERRRQQARHKCGTHVSVEVTHRQASMGADVVHTLVIRDLSLVAAVEKQQIILTEQIREVQKMESLGVFAAGLAHDFNNILASIMGHAELAIKQLATPTQAESSLTQIVRASTRASEMTDQMLTYAGRGEFNPTVLDLNITIVEVVTLIRTSINPHADIKLELLPEGAWIQGDRSQLTQVLINLVTNASDALKAGGGVIRISTAKSDDKHLTLRVWDNGKGMSEAIRRRIFEPFFSTKFAGRGLGLASVSGIAARHDAMVVVRSEIDQFSEFTFSFPLHAPPATPAHDIGQSYAHRAAGLSILVVDDQVELLDLCERILNTAGHKVQRARDGVEVLRIARQYPDLQLIVMDYSLPLHSGTEIYAQLRAEGITPPCVFISGYNISRVQAETDPAWNATVLKKPFTTDELLQGIDAVIDRESRG